MSRSFLAGQQQLFDNGSIIRLALWAAANRKRALWDNTFCNSWSRWWKRSQEEVKQKERWISPFIW
jgi:hypothetical protein